VRFLLFVRKNVLKDDEDMLPYLKRSVQATFIVVVIFYMTLLLYYRQRGINDFDQQVSNKNYRKATSLVGGEHLVADLMIVKFTIV
jgi:hypothetical protein